MLINTNAYIVQMTTYYPYGEPTVEPAGQRFLFGGKEREHAAARNTYDFSARCLTPYGNWNVIDPKADDFYSFSPYSYCAGDPINYIDPDGKGTVYLGKDDKLNRNAYRYPKDDKINVFAHGNPTAIAYTKKGDNVTIKSGPALKKAIIDNLYQSEKLLSKPFVEIVLHSCNTGLEQGGKEKPLAQKLSKEIPNAIIKAPNGLLKIDNNGKETVYDENGKKKGKDESWNIYFRGMKIHSSMIEKIHKDLLEEEKKRNEQENLKKDEKVNY